MFVGVDGHKAGWVYVVVDDGGFSRAGTCPRFEDVLASNPEAKVIGVDIPIGLVDEPGREADAAARAFLEGNASSVFNAPVRAALDAPDYDQARARSLEVAGKSISKQSFMLFPKIREVDVHIGDERIHEVHPECCFRVMNGGRLAHTKKRWGGLFARLALLRGQGIVLPDQLGEADVVGIDDVVDAAAAAWSARRIARGQARSFPEHPGQHDSSGRPIAIWA